MRWLFVTAAVAALMVVVTDAACPNKCSGHGTCTLNDVCTCMQNWRGGDCSERICPFTRAWHDVAVANDDAHWYAECGNRGMCDRDKGLCVCDDGFTGSGCRRLACPSDCSGHGTCEFIEDLAKETYRKRVGGTAGRTYALWDQEKIMGCVCDPGFHGHDCSLRTCPRGDDPLTPSTAEMKQFVTVGGSGQIYLTYFDPYGTAYTTDAIPILGTVAGLATDCASIQKALNRLPNNVLNTVTVAQNNAAFYSFTRDAPRATTSTGTIAAVGATTTGACQISFISEPGTTGYQYLFDCNPVARTAAGSHPVSTGATSCSIVEVYGATGVAGAGTLQLSELAPCSNRGTCDTTTGLCKCYAGHMGLACQKQEALV